MRVQKITFESFNLVGSVCSIIALLLTVSTKIGAANLVQLVFGVLTGISFGGLLMVQVIRNYRLYLEYESYFFTKCIYWLFLSVIVAIIALLFGRIGYWIMDQILNWIVYPLLSI